MSNSPSQYDNVEICKDGSCLSPTSQEIRNTALSCFYHTATGCLYEAPDWADYVVDAVLKVPSSRSLPYFFLADWGADHYSLPLLRVCGA